MEYRHKKNDIAPAPPPTPVADRRHSTLVFDVPTGPAPKTDSEKLRAIRIVLEDSLQNRMLTLRNECETIGLDMQSLVVRLIDQGHEAELTDIKSARWYRTAAQLELLKRLHRAFCQIMGSNEGVVHMPISDVDSGAVPVAIRTTHDDIVD
ncbi:MAG: hypothetical protein H0U23_02780 [Blastocatellia bacterium]|nr:hypothetical protein [Blastocatellia bacterium]